MAAYFGFTRRGPVSLEPPVCFAGWHPRTPPPGELEGLTEPGPVLPARIRRYVEATVMVLLAGDVAEGICYWAAGPGEGIEDPPWRQAPALPPWERAWLAEHGGGEDDVHRIRGLLQQMHGPDSAVAGAHELYLRAETRHLVRRPRFRRQVCALATELLACGTLPASRWRAVLASAQ
jgi:hypothetical protein